MNEFNKTASHNKMPIFFGGVLLLLLALVEFQFYLGNMTNDGDEPGYIYKSLSFWDTGGFQMPQSRFGKELPQFEWIVASGSYLGDGHPVLMSIIGAPLLKLFGVNGVRALSTLWGLVSIIAMACLLLPVFGATIALLATGFIIFSLPVLPYTHLFYTEMMMMMLVAGSWGLGRAGGRNHALLAVLCALLLPFVHVRSALLSPVLVLFAVIPLQRRRDWRGLAAATGLCSLGAGLFVLYQYLLFGKFVAGASSTFPPSLGDAFTRLSVQLVSFRHGLFTFNPACVPAVAGLVLGLWRRSSLAAQAGVILLVYVPTMIWSAASESWPARFWVVAMPAMAVGMGFWLVYARGLPARAAGAVLILASFENTLTLLRHNDSFLLNRLGNLSGDEQILHNHFDIAGLLPWDRFDFEIVGIDPALALNEKLLIRAMAFCCVLLLAFVVNGLGQSKQWTKWTSWLPAMALLPLLFAAAMRPLPSTLMATSSEGHTITLTFTCPAPVRLIRIMAPDRAHMFPPVYPSGLEIAAVRADGMTEKWRAPLAPTIGIPAGTYHSIELKAFGSGADGVWMTEGFVVMTAGERTLRCD